MFWQLKLLPIWLLAAATLMLAACGGNSGDDGDSGADIGGSDDGRDSEEFVLNGTEVLGRSAASFSDDVQSLSGQFEFSFESHSVSMTGEADFAFEAPDRMHMTMNFGGGEEQSIMDLSELGQVEMLSRDGTIYMNIPFLGGWFSMSAEDLGADGESLQELLSQGSVFDYAGFVDGLEAEVEYLGEEEVNGHATDHYHFAGSLADLVDAFSEALSSAGEDTFLTDGIDTSTLDGPIDVDVWVGTEDDLPYMIMTNTSTNTADGQLTMTLTGTFDGYNESVDIPEAPEDAVSFTDLFEELGEPLAAPTE